MANCSRLSISNNNLCLSYFLLYFHHYNINDLIYCSGNCTYQRLHLEDTELEDCIANVKTN